MELHEGYFINKLRVHQGINELLTSLHAFG